MVIHDGTPGKRSSQVGSYKALLWASTASAMVFEAGIWCGLGFYADAKLGTRPWLLLVGTAVGLLAFAWRVYRLQALIESSSSNSTETRKPSPP